jgi:Protein of unknown function (DUF2772).
MRNESRTTRIGCVVLNTVGSSSIAHFGDNETTSLKSRAIAVQRAIANVEKDEFRFASYGIFARPLLQLSTGVTVETRMADRCPPDIEIGCLDVTALSSSALLRAGCGGPLTAQTRVLHIRHFNYPGIR